MDQMCQPTRLHQRILWMLVRKYVMYKQTVTLASLSMTLLCEGLRPHRGTIHLSQSLENSRYLLEELWESVGCNSAKLYLPDASHWQLSLSHLIQSKETRVRLESHLFNSWGLCLIPRTLGQHPWSQNPDVAPTMLTPQCCHVGDFQHTQSWVLLKLPR